tara:strand:+ start:7232 stop:7399 length:168 start_codon:yes stop_codon:yes gene_type:complete
MAINTMAMPTNPNSSGDSNLARKIEIINPLPLLRSRLPKSHANAIPDFFFKELKL